MAKLEKNLASAWQARLTSQFTQPYWKTLSTFLQERADQGHTVYPPQDALFNALNLTLPAQVKVVIVGQDPYHGPGQAHGLCFSVQPDVKPPPSLVNIYKEMNTDLGLKRPTHGCLTRWAKQGVLLLNSVLTVEDGQANAHQGKGWESFTDAVIETLNEGSESIVFMLWGSYAQQKGAAIDSERHLVLTAPHPSPLSAHRGFFGTKPFSKANAYLLEHKKLPIDWQVGAPELLTA